ncbi:MAG: aminotransferase, partial [Firmicutes bacterium]|nr:aminotransferase [Bacillota bacterium]
MQYKKLNKEQLIAEQSLLLAEFAALKEQGLKLDMTRGKPSAEQVSISNDILTDVGADGVYSE